MGSRESVNFPVNGNGNEIDSGGKTGVKGTAIGGNLLAQNIISCKSPPSKDGDIININKTRNSLVNGSIALVSSSTAVKKKKIEKEIKIADLGCGDVSVAGNKTPRETENVVGNGYASENSEKVNGTIQDAAPPRTCPVEDRDLPVPEEAQSAQKGVGSERNDGADRPRKSKVDDPGEKPRRKSSADKVQTDKTTKMPKESHQRRSSVMAMPSLFSVHDKIDSLSRNHGDNEEHKAQPKIYKLPDQLLVIGKEQKKTDKSQRPLTRGPAKINPVLQSKILKFETTPATSKKSKLAGDLDGREAKKDVNSVCNGLHEIDGFRDSPVEVAVECVPEEVRPDGGKERSVGDAERESEKSTKDTENLRKVEEAESLTGSKANQVKQRSVTKKTEIIGEIKVDGSGRKTVKRGPPPDPGSKVLPVVGSSVTEVGGAVPETKKETTEKSKTKCVPKEEVSSVLREKELPVVGSPPTEIGGSVPETKKEATGKSLGKCIPKGEVPSVAHKKELPVVSSPPTEVDRSVAETKKEATEKSKTKCISKEVPSIPSEKELLISSPPAEVGKSVPETKKEATEKSKTKFIPKGEVPSVPREKELPVVSSPKEVGRSVPETKKEAATKSKTKCIPKGEVCSTAREKELPVVGPPPTEIGGPVPEIKKEAAEKSIGKSILKGEVPSIAHEKELPVVVTPPAEVGKSVRETKDEATVKGIDKCVPKGEVPSIPPEKELPVVGSSATEVGGSVLETKKEATEKSKTKFIPKGEVPPTARENLKPETGTKTTILKEPKKYLAVVEPKDASEPSGFPDHATEDISFRDNSRPRSPFSPFSISSDSSYDHYTQSDLFPDATEPHIRNTSMPRRIFPQVANRFSSVPNNCDKEDTPVIIDAGISFDLVRSSSVREQFKPRPAFTETETLSHSLSGKISEFLSRTDHVMEEWERIGRSSSSNVQSLAEARVGGYPKAKSKSATNIMIRSVLNLGKKLSEARKSRSASRNSGANIYDVLEVNEINADLSEERATGTLQAERLEAETAERVRLEQELSQIQQENKNLLQTSEKLEMELFYARADVNGLSEGEGDGEDGSGDAAIYKHKCERAMRELEFTRRRLQQQHEDDLEQLVALKKQLEKKLADAYEEVEEQRQVAAQWKKKVQKFQSEMNDMRLLLEEQSSRNNLLEKKQRKFDSEIQLLQDELRSEKNQKDRLSREKEMAFAEKYALEQNLSSVRLELELKEEKLSVLTGEVEELTRGGGSEQEVTQLRKAKHDLELKLKEQEEELDELAGQVSMLEGTKLRLEMSLESLRKDLRREMSQREDELDEVRSNSQKKLKALESQLENEHEERTLLLREKHELERRLNDAEERGRHSRAADEDALLRLRRDLKKTKALLRDAQMMLERAKQDSPSKAALRALKNQIEDAELARASAVKAKQSLESELNEVNGQLEEAIRGKNDAENRYQAAQRECNGLRTQVDENEEELAELLKKYRQTVQQLSAEQLANQETAGALAEAEAERASLRDQLAELTAKMEANSNLFHNPVSGMAQKRLEIRIKELESRLELESTTRSRLEVQIARLKESVERSTEECIQARNKELMANDQTRKLQRSLREAKEEMSQLQAKEQEAAHKRKELEKRLETAEQEAMTARTDLRLAVKRIEDLQIAMSGEIESDSERSESEGEEESGDESLMLRLQSSLSSSRGSKTPDLSPR